MEQKVCEIDIHRNSLVATIPPDNNTQQQQKKQTRKFQNNQTDIQQLKKWLTQHQYKKVAMKSTDIYRTTLYLTLEETDFQPVLTNARQVKRIPERKTNQTDSEWLAHLLQTDLIKPSYTPPKHLRELRTLAHLRVKYVQNHSTIQKPMPKTTQPTQHTFKLKVK